MIISSEQVFNLAEEQIKKWKFKGKEKNLFNIIGTKENFLRILILRLFSSRLINFFYEKVIKDQSNKEILDKKGRFVFSYEKELALNFIKYVIEENVKFDTKEYYEDSEKEIERYLNALIYFAFNDYIPYQMYKRIICSNEREKMFEFYKKTRKNKDYIRIMNKNYFYPFKLNIEAFYSHHGLKELPKKVLNRIDGGTFVDCGVYNGDSIIVFQQYKPKKIIGFEPDEKNYMDAKEVIDRNKMDNVTLIKKGVGEKNKVVYFKETGSVGSSISESGNKKIEVTTIDSLNEKIDLIKMDIEGYEYNAILGAEKTIKKYKPVLSISLYHTPRDFFEIPKLLKQWVPEYKMRFLDLLPSGPFGEKVLLAYIE